MYALCPTLQAIQQSRSQHWYDSWCPDLLATTAAAVQETALYTQTHEPDTIDTLCKGPVEPVEGYLNEAVLLYTDVIKNYGSDALISGLVHEGRVPCLIPVV